MPYVPGVEAGADYAKDEDIGNVKAKYWKAGLKPRVWEEASVDRHN
jgi:hypothetical protein